MTIITFCSKFGGEFIEIGFISKSIRKLISEFELENDPNFSSGK